MAELLWWRGDATTDQATIVAMSDSNNDLVISANGQTFTGTVVPAGTGFYIGKVVVTGLSESTQYAFTLTCGALSESGTLKTLPSNPSALKVIWGSCFNGQLDSTNGYQVVAEGADIFLAVGDFIYMSSNSTAFGETVPAITTLAMEKDEDNYWMRYRQMLRQSGIKAIMHNCIFYITASDHEWPEGNWDRTVEQCTRAVMKAITGITNANPPVVTSTAHGFSTGNVVYVYQVGGMDEVNYIEHTITVLSADTYSLDGVDAMGYGTYTSGGKASKDIADINAVAISCMDRMWLGNPVNTDTGIDSDADYFRKQVGSLVELFVPNVQKYRTPEGTGNYVPSAANTDSRRTMLGLSQKEWLKTKLAASPCIFKPIFSDKKTYQGGATLTDYWPKWQAERDELLAYIHANVTGNFWCTGDVHNADCHATYDGVGGEVWDHAQFHCGVFDDVGGHDQGVGYVATEVWKSWGYAGLKPTVAPVGRGMYAVIDLTTTHADISIKDRMGRVLFTGRVLAGENKLSYKTTKLSI